MKAPIPCQTLTVDDTGTASVLDTRWAVRGRSVTTGLISPRGFVRWRHNDTVCLACGHTVADHVTFTRENSYDVR